MKAKEQLVKQQQEQRARNVKSRRSSSSRPRSGGVTLKLLIDEGFLQPGAAVLSIEYRGLHEQGDLLTDGRIQWKGEPAGDSGLLVNLPLIVESGFGCGRCHRLPVQHTSWQL